MSIHDSEPRDRRTINRVLGPDGTVWAREEILHPQSPEDVEGGVLRVTVVRGTVRALPLTREEAEQWVSEALTDDPEDIKQAIVEDLCSGDTSDLMDPALAFFYDCVKAVNNQDYATGSAILESGLEAIWKQGEEVDSWELVARCIAVLRALREALQNSRYSEVLASKQGDSDVRCSFCGKPAAQVEKIIAGPNVHICNECISVCSNLVSGSK